MNKRALWIAFYGIVTKETMRWCRIWPQTLLPPLITTSLYFLIFGTVIGNELGPIKDIPYVTFIAPGLIMLSVITNTYANVSTSFFGAKFSRSIEEMLVSPMPNWLIVAGYSVGGITRGIVVGTLVFLIASLFSGIHVYAPFTMLVCLLLCCTLFSLTGLLNGILSNTFDDTTLLLTFLLTPLIYLGGIFYNLENLSPFWRTMSYFNPIAYLIDLFRYAMLGQGTDWIFIPIALLIFIVLGLSYTCCVLLNKGTRLKG